MKSALVIFDTAYGNTAEVARAISGELEKTHRVTLRSVDDVQPVDMKDISILVVGSPTQAGKPTQGIQQFLEDLPEGSLRTVRVAAFDTRFAEKEHGLGLRLLMKTIGFAAGRIASALQDSGGQLAAEPAGFIVEDKEGPLKKGELERAVIWAKSITAGTDIYAKPFNNRRR